MPNRIKPIALVDKASGFSVLTLLALAIYTVFTYQQWQTTEKTLSEVSKQTTTSTNAANAAKDAAKAAQDAVTVARDNFRQDQRAYVLIQILSPPLFASLVANTQDGTSNM